MARVTVEDCLQKVTNRYALVHLAAKRTKQLLKGSKPQVKSPGNKDAVVALREIAEDKVEVEGNIDFTQAVIEVEEELPPDQRD